MTRPWTILQHVAWEGPGLIAVEGKARGLCMDTRRLDLAAGIPQPEEVEGLVVMGGPMGVYETDKHPNLAEECKLIAELVRTSRPVLGVCLGAQLLAKALGARVVPGRAPEIGFGFVELTEEGNRDPLFGPGGPTLPVFHWHGDTFGLPQGATLLASSIEYPHQAFRFGSCAYGLQFHIEPVSDIWSSWHEHLPAALIAGSEQTRREIEGAGRGLFARFFNLALDGDRQSKENATPNGLIGASRHTDH